LGKSTFTIEIPLDSKHIRERDIIYSILEKIGINNPDSLIFSEITSLHTQDFWIDTLEIEPKKVYWEYNMLNDNPVYIVNLIWLYPELLWVDEDFIPIRIFKVALLPKEFNEKIIDKMNPWDKQHYRDNIGDYKSKQENYYSTTYTNEAAFANYYFGAYSKTLEYFENNYKTKIFDYNEEAFIYGFVLNSLKQNTIAIEILEEAITVRQDNCLKIYKELGLSYCELGEIEKGIAYYIMALEEMKKSIYKDGFKDINKYDNDDYWFDVEPSVEIAFHIALRYKQLSKEEEFMNWADRVMEWSRKGSAYRFILEHLVLNK
jgi:tetratricopeptide (TPR) repeat protein